METLIIFIDSILNIFAINFYLQKKNTSLFRIGCTIVSGLYKFTQLVRYSALFEINLIVLYVLCLNSAIYSTI
jgi:hypothetical protein